MGSMETVGDAAPAFGSVVALSSRWSYLQGQATRRQHADKKASRERTMDGIRPVLDQVNVVSRDLDASLTFYRRLGVDIPDGNVWRTPSGAHHANAAQHPGGPAAIHLDLDSTAFAPHWNAGWAGRSDLAGRVVVGFRVPNRSAVDALYGEMTAAGYRGLQAPWDAFWGARYAVIEDPDGIAVGLMSPVSADKRSAPPTV
jgi:catechol 2,3-dioxygenase-like lactoylglutathione lyase family enzyme